MINSYRFLPFRYKKIHNKVLLINDVGEYIFSNPEIFKKFAKKEIDLSSEEFFDLKSKNMLCDSNRLAENINLMAIKYRTKKQFLYEFTSLHMMVITQRCNQRCTYCHASSIDENSDKIFDMSIETAKKCVDTIFLSPSSYLKIEFQGGEPLLNFNAIKETVLYAKKKNDVLKKEIDYVICTNLINLKPEYLSFIEEHNICLSTSLDGPLEIHDSCRQYKNGEGTYKKVIDNLLSAKIELGEDKISALMTVTPNSLHRLKDVVDEYLRLGLPSIFIRMLNPYGMAAKNSGFLGYGIKEFVEAYKDILKYIIKLNLSGIFFPEEFATLLLTKILTPFSTGFVDLQSPTGAGIGGAIYEVNGDVFIADEGRMLAKMKGDKTFCIGNVHKNSWHSIFCNPKLKDIVASTCIECAPGCAWCVYQPYCGSDPIRNYLQFNSFSGNSVKNDFCKKHKAIFDFLFSFLEEDNDEVINVFWSWITNRDLKDVQLNTFNKNTNT